MATARQAHRAIELHQAALVEYPNVTGLGVVAARRQEATGDSAVAVYVREKVPRSLLRPDELIPRTLEIPARKGTNSVPTRVIATGEMELETNGFDIESI